jgi:hypothetical protein
MQTIAVFLGAGASKAFGYLLTNELLPRIRDGLDRGTLFTESQPHREELLTYLTALLPGLSTISPKNLPLITDVLSLIDHSLSVSNSLLSLRTPQSMDRFRALLERAIIEILMEPSSSENSEQYSALLEQFTRWITLQRESKNYHLGIISTNYDIAVETLLFEQYDKREPISSLFDFGFSWRDPGNGSVYKRPVHPHFQFYKLHGSLNWLRCNLCEHIYINTDGIIADLAFIEPIRSYNTCHCNYAPLRSVIIAPSLVRDIRDVNLLDIWKNTLELLRTADEWIIIGYSLPSEDIAIRSLFIKAYNGREKPPHIQVIQKGETAASTYKLFFPHCQYEHRGLEHFLLQTGA